MSKLYSVWQWRTDEDGQTAMVFGFLRHAPATDGLDLWLSEVLGREVRAKPLGVDAFWPRYTSSFDGHQITEPDVVIELTDGTLVIVEAKIDLDGHTDQQLARELVDVAEGGAKVEVVALGLSLGRPPGFDQLRSDITDALASRGSAELSWALSYSSWAQLGKAIRQAAQRQPLFDRYAVDVLKQMEMRNMLGYQGAPTFDDLTEISPATAFAAANRTTLAALQFFRTLEAEDEFKALGLESMGNMWSDGRSFALTSEPRWLERTGLLCCYRKGAWPEDVGLFVGIDLVDDDLKPAEICAGAFLAPGRTGTQLADAWAYSESGIDHENFDARLDLEFFDHGSIEGTTQWAHPAGRPWLPGAPAEDIAWAVETLRRSAEAWDTPRRSSQGRTSAAS